MRARASVSEKDRKGRERERERAYNGGGLEELGDASSVRGGDDGHEEPVHHHKQLPPAVQSVYLGTPAGEG